MKITKESFEKVLLEIMWERKNPTYDFDVIELALQRLTGKGTQILKIVHPENVASVVMDKVTLEDAKLYQDFFHELESSIPHEVLNGYLSPIKDTKEDANAFSTEYVDDISEGLSKNCNLVVTNNTWVGEDIVLIISRGIGAQEQSSVEYNIISKIVYTEDSMDAAKDIWMKYSELALETYKNRIKEPEQLYRIEIVGTDRDGCLYSYEEKPWRQEVDKMWIDFPIYLDYKLDGIGCITQLDSDLYPELTWEDEPLEVNLVAVPPQNVNLDYEVAKVRTS